MTSALREDAVNAILGGDPLLTTRQAAAYTGLSGRTILRKVANGTLESLQTGPNGHRRYRLSALDKLLGGQP